MANDNVPPHILRNFDELASPSPAKTNKERLWLGYSADNLRSKSKKTSGDLSGSNGEPHNEPDDYPNLDEIAAPAPIDEDAEKGEPHLEDQRNGSSALPSPQGSSRGSRLETEVYTIAHLILFSILGTLSRLGLQALTHYPGAPVQTPVLWPNVAGSFILGFLSEDQRLFRPPTSDSPQDKAGHDRNKHNAHKKTIPLYIGLATGYCGSFTSFSSFIRDAFYALSNALPVPIQHPSLASPPSPISTNINVHRNGGYSFLALLAVIISTVGLSLAALQVGAQLALGCEKYTPSIAHLVIGRRKVVDRLSVFLAAGVWLAAVIMAAVPPDRHNTSPYTHETWRSQALFALVFAPLGCLVRFYASVHLNGRMPSFPLGTFAVNTAGSALLAMFIVLQHAPVGGLVGCQVLQGMGDGFCGCLTTVSTWVSELKGLRRRHGWVYGAWSVGVGICLFVIISGSLMWSQGFKPALCMA